jgi:glycosyltransferase involved in cell wall biosynthesis
MENKLISIIIPTYNRADFIAETMNSVWNQRFCPVEMIIVDDGSTDDTKKMVDDWIGSHNGKGFECRCIYQRHKGAPAARNKGAGAADGEFLMFLDSDDLLSSNALTYLAETLKNEETGIGACHWNFWVENNTHWHEKPGIPLLNSSDDLLEKWLGGWYIPPCAILWKQASFKKTGEWDETLSANQDGDLILRYLAAGGQIAFAKQGKALYRRHANKAAISDATSLPAIKSREKVLDKLARQLKKAGTFQHYRAALAGALYYVACDAYFHHYRDYGDQLCEKVERIDPSFRTENLLHRSLENVVGIYYKEQFHRWFNYWVHLLFGLRG